MRIIKLLSGVVLLWALALSAPAEEKAPAKAPAELKSALKELLGTQAEAMQINPSPIPGLYEIVADTYVFYASKDGRYLIRGGDILDLQQDVRNLTEERRNGLRLRALETVPEKDMIVFSPEKETKHVLTVFTDVDCFYCAKLHQEVSKLNQAGVEVRYLAFPRSGPGSPTHNKMVSVWCADDRQQAITDAKNRKPVPSASCDNPVNEEYNLGRQLGVSGTPALVLPNGELLPGYAPAEKLVSYLEKSEE